jgi:acetyl-CoA carboxylase biotin carboxyl carrier protein
MSDGKPILDKELIRELAELLAETGLSEIEIERDKMRVRVARTLAPATTIIPATALPAAAVTAAGKAEGGGAVEPSAHKGTVHSPMVGTAFRAPEPGAKPYVEVGDRVNEGQTLLIIEAMKTMNQIPAPRAGVVTEILVEDAQPVEYGEPLMIVE